MGTVRVRTFILLTGRRLISLEVARVMINPLESNELLLAYLSEKNENIASNISEQIILKIRPLIEKIVGAHMHNLLGSPTHFSQLQDIPDVRQEIIIRLLTYFSSLRQQTEPKIVKDLNAYVATVCYNCCYEYKQRKYPQRFRLKKKLQYLFTHHSSLGIWQDETQEWFGGLRDWGGDLKHWQIQSQQRTQQLLNDPLPRALQDVIDPTLRKKSAVEQVVELFNWSNQFIHLSDLITIFQKWWNLTDETVQFDEYFIQQPPDVLKVEIALESSHKLKAVWSEITFLPLPQRRVLLLNLRDSIDRELLTLLPALKIASLREIAATLEISPDNLGRVWNCLPLNDQQIATHMGLERRQVINLRRTARERLIRRVSPTL